MQETQVPSQVWEDPLEKEMATHSRILAWETPGAGVGDGGGVGAGWAGAVSQRVRHHLATKQQLSILFLHNSLAFSRVLYKRNQDIYLPFYIFFFFTQ